MAEHQHSEPEEHCVRCQEEIAQERMEVIAFLSSALAAGIFFGAEERAADARRLLDDCTAREDAREVAHGLALKLMREGTP